MLEGYFFQVISPSQNWMDANDTESELYLESQNLLFWIKNTDEEKLVVGTAFESLYLNLIKYYQR